MIQAAQEEAMGPCRLWPVCAITGKAAYAAVLALQQNVAPRCLDVGFLEKTLPGQGVGFGLSSEVIA